MSAAEIMAWAGQTGLMVTLLIGFVLLVRRPVGYMFGAKAAYALWLLPISRLFLPQITVPRLFPSEASAEIITNVQYIADGTFAAPVSRGIDWAAIVPPLVLGIWALGAVVFLAYNWLSQARICDGLRYYSRPAGFGLQKKAARVASYMKLSRSPEIRLSEDGAGPLVCHAARPTIYLPFDFDTRFSSGQQDFALMHELSHIKRGDLWAAWGWLIFRALNWPNPLVHYASQAFRSDQEAACDATVLSKTQSHNQPSTSQRPTVADYAETLLRAAQSAAQSTGGATPIPSQLALTIHQPLKERLLMLNPKKTRASWPMRASLAALIIAAFGVTAPLTQAASHPDEELAGKSEENRQKSVIKIDKTDDDGNTVRKHFEITVKDGEVEAYEIDSWGRKTVIEPSEIEGLNGKRMKKGEPMKFGLSDNNRLKVLTEKDFEKWDEAPDRVWFHKAEKHREMVHEQAEQARKDAHEHADKAHKEARKAAHERMKEAMEKRVETRMMFHSEDGKVVILDDEGENVFVMPEPPEPPHFPDRFEGRMDMQEMHVTARMKAAESMLAQAERMIAEAEVSSSNSRNVSQAKRELERARKALKKAEKALRED